MTVFSPRVTQSHTVMVAMSVPRVPEATWRALLDEAGFSRFLRATETPFNRVFEARP